MKGFTTVELLISIAVVGIIATVVVVGLRDSGSNQQVARQSANVVSLLQLAQTKAFNGEQHNGVVPTGGYAVLVEDCDTSPCEVVLYADFNADHLRSDDEVVEVLSLGDDIQIEVTDLTEVNISFSSPHASICFNAECGAVDASFQVLSNKTNKVGLVSIDATSGKISSEIMRQEEATEQVAAPQVDIDLGGDKEKDADLGTFDLIDDKFLIDSDIDKSVDSLKDGIELESIP